MTQRQTVPAAKPLRWIIPLAALAFATLALSRAGDAQSPTAAAPSAHRTLSPLSIDPNGAEDPAITFERWRRENRVTMVAPHYVVHAHRQWMRAHRAASPSATPAPSPTARSSMQSGSATLANITAGTNVDLDNVQDYQGEVAIAVNPANSNQLVAGANTAFTDPHCPAPGGSAQTQALYGSTDGGGSWTYACAPWPANLSQGPGPIFFGSDPTVAWDNAGNAYAAYLLISQNQSGKLSSSAIEVAKSADSGKSWAAFGTVVNNLSNPTVFDDKEMMAVDTTSGQAHSFTNRIYVIWDENNTEQISSTGNGTFSAPVVLEDAADQGTDIGGDVAIGPDGTVNVIWNRLQSDNFGNQVGETTVFAASTDGGATFSSPVTIATHNLFSFGSNNVIPAQDVRAINAFAAIAVDRSTAHPGNLYAVYTDYASAGTSSIDTNIYMVRSTNGGATWSSPPVQLNDDNGGASQFFPWVAVDASSGTVSVSWYDTRNNSPAFKRTQMFATISTDGGTTFSANQLVTSTSAAFTNSVAFSDENSGDNPNSDPNQYGDYAQIDALDGVAHLIWTDSRMFFPADTTNTVAEEAASAQLSFAGASGSPTPTATPTPSAIGPLRVRPLQVNFHDHRVGTTAGPRFVRVVNPRNNTGDATLNGIGIGPVPPSFDPFLSVQSDFQVDSAHSTCTAGMILARGKSCRVAVLFSPSSAQSEGASLLLNDNASSSPQSVPLTGVGK